MSGEEFVLSIIALVMGSVVLIVGITKITGLIKSWLNHNKGIEEETFERLARAFMQHKKDTDRRLKNLEAIVADDEATGKSDKQLQEPHKTIEIEDTEQEESKSSNPDSNLRNMLRE